MSKWFNFHKNRIQKDANIITRLRQPKTLTLRLEWVDYKRWANGHSEEIIKIAKQNKFEKIVWCDQVLWSA